MNDSNFVWVMPEQIATADVVVRFLTMKALAFVRKTEATQGLFEDTRLQGRLINIDDTLANGVVEEITNDQGAKFQSMNINTAEMIAMDSIVKHICASLFVVSEESLAGSEFANNIFVKKVSNA